MWSKGYAADETKAAFARVEKLATEIGDPEAPLDAYYGRWGRSLFRGEVGLAREAAESFLREADTRGAADGGRRSGIAILGLTLLYQGDFEPARAHLEQALRLYDPERDREAKFRLGQDTRAAATSYLALAAWCLGDVGRARKLMDEAVAHAVESAHAPTLANAYYFRAVLEILRDDAGCDLARGGSLCRAQPEAWSWALSCRRSAAVGLGACEVRRSGWRSRRVSIGAGRI